MLYKISKYLQTYIDIYRDRQPIYKNHNNTYLRRRRKYWVREAAPDVVGEAKGISYGSAF